MRADFFAPYARFVDVIFPAASETVKKSFVWKNPICRLWRAGLCAECARIILAFGTFQCHLTRPPPGQFFYAFVCGVGGCFCDFHHSTHFK
jgi:hypothetical protein